ncbi:MAG: hypothetical protein CMLOHMNK_02251 [Steroidobacteraceae bacterium]|nr:hypothetical protein [Steroidobacteraceae bacterium]
MLELRPPQKQVSLPRIGGLAAFFILVAWQADFVVASAVLAAGISGYLLQFYALRVAVALIRRRKPDALSIGYGAIGVFGSAALNYFGFALVLGLGFGLWFVLDAVVLRFA